MANNRTSEHDALCEALESSHTTPSAHACPNCEGRYRYFILADGTCSNGCDRSTITRAALAAAREEKAEAPDA
jgi:hypothetical protein